MIKSFLFKLSLLLLPFAIVIALVNWWVDPANVFSFGKYEKGIASILLKGHNIDNVSNYDQRIVQKYVIEEIKYVPDIVILGSSRIMELGSEEFEKKHVLNCAVSHANIYDVISIIGLLDSLKKMPPEIVINIDPYLVCKGESAEWQSISAFNDYINRKWFQKANAELQSSGFLTKVEALISFEYFRESLRYLNRPDFKNYKDVGTGRPVSGGRFADGSICYPASYINPDTATVIRNAFKTAKKEGLGEVDDKKMDLLGLLVSQLYSRGVKLQFILLPYHKEFFETVNTFHSDKFRQYESMFRQFAQERKIPIKGTFDPAKANISRPEFYDMYHCNKENVRKIFKSAAL